MRETVLEVEAVTSRHLLVDTVGDPLSLRLSVLLLSSLLLSLRCLRQVEPVGQLESQSGTLDNSSRAWRWVSVMPLPGASSENIIAGGGRTGALFCRLGYMRGLMGSTPAINI